MMGEWVRICGKNKPCEEIKRFWLIALKLGVHISRGKFDSVVLFSKPQEFRKRTWEILQGCYCIA